MESPISKLGLNLADSWLMLIAGRSNTGKSHFIRWLFSEMRNRFAYGVVFTTTAFEGAYDFLPDGYVHDEYSDETVHALIDVQKRAHKKAKKRATKMAKGREVTPEDIEKYFPRAFVLLDDCCADNEFKSPALKLLATAGRHYNITTILSTQYIHLCPPVIRANTNYGLFFDVGLGRSEMEATYNWIGGRFKSFDNFREFYNANTDKHKFIMYDRDTNSYRVFRAPPTIPRFRIKFRRRV